MNTKVRRITITAILAAIALLILVSAREFTAYAREIGIEDEFSSRSSSLADGQRQAGETELYGVIEAMSAQSWIINGQVVVIQPSTEIKGSLAVGDTVKVHVFRDHGGSLIAREIDISLARPGVNANTNEANDDNSNTSFSTGQNSNNSGLNENGEDNGNANDNLNGDDDNSNANDDNSNDDNANNDNGDDHGGKSGKGG